MKIKIVSALVYGVAACALAGYFDFLYGAGPVDQRLGLVRAALAGLVLLAFASGSSLLSKELGTLCALVGVLLSWPLFAVQLNAVPWNDLIWFARYRRDSIAAILALVIATIYVIGQSWFSLRKRRAASAGSPIKRNIA